MTTVVFAGLALVVSVIALWPWRRKWVASLFPAEFPRPQGVTIVRANGDVVPCELVFDGVDEDGCGQWAIDTPVKMFQGDRLHIDVLPARTGVVWPVQR